MNSARKISFSEILRKSAKLTIDNIGLFIMLGILATILVAILLIIPVITLGFEGAKGVLSYSLRDVAVTLRPTVPSLKYIVFGLLYSLLIWVCIAVYWTGLIRIAFDLIDKGASTVRQLFVSDRKLITCISTSCLLFPIILLGLFCFVIPGIYIGISCMFYGALIIDRDIPSAFEALKESYALTKGYRWQLFVWVLLCIILAKIIGGLISPLFLISNVLIYRQLQEFKSMH